MTDPTPTHTPATGDPIVVNSLDLPTEFDPTDTTDPYTTRIASLLQRGLFRYDAKGKSVPEVAQTVETTDDRVYRVTLAEGWRFSNGEPVTADSFVDAWSLAADPAHPRLRRDLFAPIEGFVPSADLQPTTSPATAPATPPPGSKDRPTGRSPRLAGLTVLDGRTFTITLSRPHPKFDQRLGHAVFAPLPDVAFTDPAGFRRAPVGNGPYQIEGAWTADGDLRLRPNAAYTAADPAQNAGLVFRPYSDPAAAWRDVEAGRLDVLDVVPTHELADYQGRFGERAVNQPVGVTLGLVVPAGAPHWSGEAGTARRAALSLAIDREALAREVFAGTRTVATDLAAPVVEGHSRDLCAELCRLDRDEALSLLAGAGPPPGGVSIAYADDLDEGPFARALCADLTSTLQVTCTPREYLTAQALAEAVDAGRESGPYLARHQMDYPQLESFLVPRFALGALTNDSGYADPATDAALTRAATATPPERIPRFQAVQKDILETLPVIPLVNVHATAVSSAAVNGVRIDVFGSPGYTQIRRP